MVKLNLTVDQGPCNGDLRSWCMGIAIYFLISITINVIFLPTVVNFIGFAIVVVGNICLLFGCLRYNHVLVLVWLIQALIWAIGWPIAIFGSIFNFGGYRQAVGTNNVFTAIFWYIIELIFYFFCSRLVYSYHLQLKNRQSQPQHAVVV